MASSWKMVREKQKENEGIGRKWGGPVSPDDIFCYKANSEAFIFFTFIQPENHDFLHFIQEFLEKLVRLPATPNPLQKAKRFGINRYLNSIYYVQEMALGAEHAEISPEGSWYTPVSHLGRS